MIKRNYNIYLVPTWELANDLPFVPHATVEAEYGNNVLEGRIITLAHHVEKYKNCPSPCNVDLRDFSLPISSNIVISHFDLDTIGGILALTGNKYYIDEFWKIAEYIDLNGPHHIHKFPQNIQDLFNAYWSYTAENRAPRITEITDVTDIVFQHGQVLDEILEINGNNLSWIEKGKIWAANVQKETESKLVMETENYRVFSTDGVFCGASYYSPTHKTIAKVCISFNEKFKAITVSCSDNSLDCRELVQKLWGKEAGEHKGIAGSPRGITITQDDLKSAVYMVKREILDPHTTNLPCKMGGYTGKCTFDYAYCKDCPVYKKCVKNVFEWGYTFSGCEFAEPIKSSYACNRCNYTWESNEPTLCPICSNSPTHEKE